MFQFSYRGLLPFLSCIEVISIKTCFKGFFKMSDFKFFQMKIAYHQCQLFPIQTGLESMSLIFIKEEYK